MTSERGGERGERGEGERERRGRGTREEVAEDDDAVDHQERVEHALNRVRGRDVAEANCGKCLGFRV